jgi:hypothetical protein
MYQVRQKGKVIEQFGDFILAWLYVYLELDSHARIVGPDGIWSVNPGQHTIN